MCVALEAVDWLDQVEVVVPAYRGAATTDAKASVSRTVVCSSFLEGFQGFITHGTSDVEVDGKTLPGEGDSSLISEDVIC
jgi:hypothetical protein